MQRQLIKGETAVASEAAADDVKKKRVLKRYIMYLPDGGQKIVYLERFPMNAQA